MSELLEKILDNKNMNEAYRKVCANKGAGGVDGMEISELDLEEQSRIYQVCGGGTHVDGGWRYMLYYYDNNNELNKNDVDGVYR